MLLLKFLKADIYQDRAGTHLDLLVSNPAMARDFVSSMQNGKVYEAAIQEERKRRSLDANAYCWVLIGKIAAATQQRKDDIYRHAIREIGDNFIIFPVKDNAISHWRKIWSHKGLGWVSDIVGPSKLRGYTNIINYYGSSTYDTKQMSCLIDTLIADCKELGIETVTPLEVARMKEGWK